MLPGERGRREEGGGRGEEGGGRREGRGGRREEGGEEGGMRRDVGDGFGSNLAMYVHTCTYIHVHVCTCELVVCYVGMADGRARPVYYTG